VAALTLRLATRGSALARWQTDHVGRLLRRVAGAAGLDLVIETVVVDTAADRRLDIPIWEMGGKGVFVKEIQAAVLDGRADVAVHSAKDLPSSGSLDDLVLAAVPQRADPRDVLIGRSLGTLAPAARVATGSVRRRAQLASLRPDLTFTGLRGNIATRLEKVPEGGAIVMAVAAVVRLGIDLVDRQHEILSPALMLPQVAQGALAVECRSDRADVLDLLPRIEHQPSRVAVDAERAFLAELGGDCDLPAGAYCTVDDDGGLTLDVLLASLDGHVVLRHRAQGRGNGIGLGEAAARHLLDDAGGSSLLAR
jgi:hydroxymethylbilane synthase